MAIHDYVIANQNGANTRSDLNNAFSAIVSNNSSATEPTTTYAYQWWADTGNDLLKQRNAADSAWISILTLSTGAVSNAAIADDAVTLAKMAAGTDGELITYDTSGDPTTVPTGSSGEVLTSNGAGTTPTFQTSTHTPDDNSVTLAKMAGGTDGNLITYDASGDPAYVTTGTSGQVLTSGGTGVAPTFQTAAGGGGGITEAETWRITSLFQGNASPLNANWEVDNDFGGATLGTGMTQSSGVFTFPSTGFWSVKFFSYHYDNADCRSIQTKIEVTTNNSTYNTASLATTFVQQTSSDSAHTTSNHEKIIDVTNTSNVKVRFSIAACSGVSTNAEAFGVNHTGAIFIRLGDT